MNGMNEKNNRNENNCHVLKAHFQENYTQTMLAKKFDIPLTAVKQCFKSIYGMLIGNWILNYRMNYVVELFLSRICDNAMDDQRHGDYIWEKIKFCNLKITRCVNCSCMIECTQRVIYFGGFYG